jgi:RNA polymerase sigma factor (sigma-70 family)
MYWQMMTDDMALLREYARHNSEEAFAALASRRVNLVYSVALQEVHDPHLAEEITQAVFIILARKADSLGDKTILSGWLCRTARYARANALTIQRRRQRREQEACMQSVLNESEPDVWTQITPLLGGAMKQLGQKDHDAVVLRFFEGKSFQEIGLAFGASENAAKKRVAHALEKLRKYFSKRGVTSTAETLAGTISANSVQAAPALLAKSATAVALAKGATASLSTLALIKGALKIMAWTKVKTITAAGLGLLLITAMTGTFVAMRAGNPPREPTYQNKSLRQWIAAQPSLPWGLTGEDIDAYRRTALLAMGEPAVHYLRWMIAHPQQTLEDESGPRRPPPNRSNLANVVLALALIGPAARAAAPDLVRLWEREDKRNPMNPMYADYNGFPLAFAELGDASPEILAALHRHFNSPDPLHSAFCALAAWRLNPNDSDAISFLRRELTASDGDDYTRSYVRYALLDNFLQYTTNSTPFLPEIRNLIDASTNAKPDLQWMAADAAWHILHRTDPANALIRHLGAEAGKTNATVEDVNEFVSAALNLSQVPGVAEYSMPVLRELGRYKDASAASFATNILDRIKTTTQGEVTSPP